MKKIKTLSIQTQLQHNYTTKRQHIQLRNYGRACMLSSHDPLPFICLPKSGGLSESSWH